MADVQKKLKISETPVCNESERSSRRRSGVLILRVLCAFVLLGALLALLYWWGYSSYPDVAEWVEPGNHDAFIYKGDTYVYAGQLGRGVYTKSKYPIGEMIGQIKDDGEPVTTESVTTEELETEEEFYPDDTETWEETETETEPETVIPPAGAHLFENKKHTYILYSVEKNEDYLILLAEDGEYYVYQLTEPQETVTDE